MWWELLPYSAVLLVMTVLPNYAHMGVNTVLHRGYKWGRNFPRNHKDYISYVRDKRMTGNFYKARGLEAIPDK